MSYISTIIDYFSPPTPETNYLASLFQYPAAAIQANKRRGQAKQNQLTGLGIGRAKQQARPFSIPSSVATGWGYDSSTQQLLIYFHEGKIYAYEGVSQMEANMVAAAQGVCVSDGYNQYGRWWKGKYPSVGAAINQILKGKKVYRRIA